MIINETVSLEFLLIQHEQKLSRKHKLNPNRKKNIIFPWLTFTSFQKAKTKTFRRTRSQIRSLASSMTIEFPRTTTIPICFCSPVLVNSTVSSKTTFMNGSKPRRRPSTARPPLIFRWIWNRTLTDLKTQSKK